jgi:hypothetical protein
MSVNRANQYFVVFLKYFLYRTQDIVVVNSRNYMLISSKQAENRVTKGFAVVEPLSHSV